MMRLHAEFRHVLRRMRDDRGVTLIEYGILVALVAAALLGVSAAMYRATTTAYNDSEGRVAVPASACIGDEVFDANTGKCVPNPIAISKLTPNSGTIAGGTTVVITGKGFAQGASVTFGGAAATVSWNSSTQLTVVTPPGVIGTTNVVITNPDPVTGGDPVALAGLTVTGWNLYTYEGAPPTIISIAPANGPPAGGTAVTITGTNFSAGASVSIGGSSATGVTVVSASQITATTPSGSGTKQVVVTNVDGLSTTDLVNFVYDGTSGPTISGITPSSGSTTGGTNVTITGTGFTNGATVTIGGAAATNVVVVSATQITARTPAGAAGPANVLVTNPDSQYFLGNGLFTYTSAAPAPSVTSISPTSGSTSGGTSVTITGTGFVSGATVKFDSASATAVTVVNSTTITATTPAGSAGAASVLVTNPDLQASNANVTFTYVGAPAISGLTPTSGAAAGGWTLTINGSGFTSGATVQLGGTGSWLATTFVSASQLTLTVPAGTGSPTVQVKNPDGQTSNANLTFAYLGSLSITGISPSFGGASGGYTVTITGTGFASNATVAVSGSGSNPTNVSVNGTGTTITLTMPSRAAGARTVTVTNPGGQTATTSFLYLNSNPDCSVSATVLYSPVDIDVTPCTNVRTNRSVTVTGSGSASAADQTHITFTPPTSGFGTSYVDFSYRTGRTNYSGLLIVTWGSSAPAPVISSVSPSTGSTTGGYLVTISGTGFASNATVTVSGTGSNPTNVSVNGAGTSITLTMPARAAGARTITVANPDTQSDSVGFTYLRTPDCSITATANHSPVEIDLMSCGAIPWNNGNYYVEVISGQGTVTRVSGGQSVIFTPPSTGSGTTIIYFDYPYTGPTSLGQLTVNWGVAPPPTISGISPSSGSTAGGFTATISGSNFDPNATVSVSGSGSAPTNVSVNGAGTSITLTMPARPAGTRTVTVTNPDSQSANVSVTYAAVSAPSATTGGDSGFQSHTVTGTVSSNGGQTTVTFCYRVNNSSLWNGTTCRGTEVTADQSPLSSSASGASVSATFNAPWNWGNDTYYYAVKAVNSAGTTLGSTQSFTR